MFSRILTNFNITHVVIPGFGFEGWILIATVPDICVCGTVSSMLSGLKTRSLGLYTLGTT